MLPFGEESGEEQGKQNFKYNGKELDKTHGLNQYDYAARFMDPSMIRFTTVDPLAEKYFSWSPYVYVANNPMKFIDPDGKEKLIFFDPKKGNEERKRATAILISGAEKSKDDGAIHIFSHGNNQGLYPETGGKTEGIKTKNQFISFLDKHSDTWKDRKEGETITIILHSCNTGKGEESIAEKLSNIKGVRIIAPDNPDYISENGELGTYIPKYQNEDGTYKQDKNGIPMKQKSDKEGNWRVFERGKEVNAYRGSWNPKENPNWWDIYKYKK